MSIITKKSMSKKIAQLEVMENRMHWASMHTNSAAYANEMRRLRNKVFAFKREYRVALKYGLQIVI